MVDEFEELRKATARRHQAQMEWEAEVRRMRESGWSVRAIAPAAGVSHMTVWELTK